MIRALIRVVAVVPLLWALGFAAFVVLLPRPAAEAITTDVIVVPTGGPGRIARGADLLGKDRAKRMLISGADRTASAASIARAGKLDRRLFRCCVDVGHEASNTRANAEETAAWLTERKAKSVRLVTTDWHMPRARFELDRIVAPDIVIVDDAVRGEAGFAVLMREYNKYLLRRIAVLGGLVNVVRSLIYALVFYIGSVPYVVGALLLIPVGQSAVIRVARAWAQFHYTCARWLLGNPVRVEGELATDVVIFAIKHECFFETFETLRLLDRPAVVFKAELLSVPLWGRVAQAHGVIPVARETGSTALRRMLKAAREAVAAGRPVVIFPEGTRVPHGQRPPLRPGVAGLYKALDLPIVPVAVDSGARWGWKSFIKRPGPVTFRVGETIPTGLPRDEVEARVHTAINALNR